MTSRLMVLVVVFLHCFHLSFTISCTDDKKPVAEGSTLVFQRPVPKTASRQRIALTWRLISAAGSEITITTCYRSQKPACPISIFPEIYNSTLTAVKGARAGKDLAFKMRINEVTRIRDQTRWSWFDGKSRLGECTLEVYSFQKDPTCDVINIIDEGKTVSWNCDVYNIYPNVTCMFAFQLKEDKKTPKYQRITPIIMATRKGTHPSRTTYHDVKCHLSVPVDSIKDSGNYLFRFKAMMFETIARSVKPAELFLGTLGFPPDYELIIQHYKTNPGKDVSLEFPITGFPSPKSFNLSRIRTSKIRTNETGEVEVIKVKVRVPIDVDRYNATYTPGNFTRGNVSLTMFNMAADESAYYVLSVDNGVGGVLDYKYYVFVKPGPDEPLIAFLWFALDAAQLGLGIGVIMAVLCFIAGMKVQNRRISRKMSKKEIMPRREEEFEEEGEEETVNYEDEEGEVAPSPSVQQPVEKDALTGRYGRYHSYVV